MHPPDPPPGLTVAPLVADHWPDVEAIYRLGIATGHATFESSPPSWAGFDTTRSADHRIVALDAGGRVRGWAAVSPVSGRAVYAGVVEHSVYVDPAAGGRGVGRLLLDALVTSTELAGVWTLQSGVFPENVASLRLHAAAGFRTVGVRERVGRMTYGPLAGWWRDVVFIERRSPTVGVSAEPSD